MLVENPDTRVILFSQWYKLFEAVQIALKVYGIDYVLCKGSVHMRTNAIKRFNEDEKCRVIMLSLEAAASGANLQKATHVILMDPPAGSKEEADAIEAQAIGRAYRQGQDKKLIVIRMMMRNTIEEQMLERKDEIELEWKMDN